MRVRTNFQEGYAEIGRSEHARRIAFRCGAMTGGNNAGVAHLTLDEARELHTALCRVMGEVEDETTEAVPVS